jgi:hypothetical protein
LLFVSSPHRLIGRSVLVRLDHDPVAEVVLPRIRSGQISVALVTELEQLVVLHYDPDFDLIAEVTG